MGDSTENRRPFLERLSAALDLMSFDADERQRGRDYARDSTKHDIGLPDWDEYFHAIAQAVALKSKDKRRRVGAVVVGEGHVILSTGFNGLPRGVREIPERMEPQEEKYRWITHAETNAIFNAARSGVPLVGGTLYVTTFPCGACAQAIVQSGIKRLFTYGEYWKNDPNGYEKALEMLAEGHIVINAPVVRTEDAELRRAERKAQAAKVVEQLELGGTVANDVADLRLGKGLAKALRHATSGPAKPRKRKTAGGNGR